MTTWFVYVVVVDVVVAEPKPPYRGTFAHTVTGTLPVSRFVDVASSVAPSGFPGPLSVACMIPMFAVSGSAPFEALPRDPYAFTWKAMRPFTTGDTMSSLFGNNVLVTPTCSFVFASWLIRQGPYTASVVYPLGSGMQLKTSMSGSESFPVRIAL